MPTILPFDDFEPGRFVTIHSVRAATHPARRRRPSPFEGEEPEVHIHLGAPSTRIPQPGVPLEILATNAPFLMVMVAHPGGRGEGPVYLDTRRLRIMAVPDGMIEVLRELDVEAARPAGSETAFEGEEECPF